MTEVVARFGFAAYVIPIAVRHNTRPAPFEHTGPRSPLRSALGLICYCPHPTPSARPHVFCRRRAAHGELGTPFSDFCDYFVLQDSKFQLSIFGGLNFFPYEGTIFVDAQITVDSILGDAFYQQSDSLTLDEMRELEDAIPSLLVSPELGLSFQYRIKPKLGLVIDAAITQGAFISIGMFFSQ